MGSAHVNRMCGYVGDVLAMLMVFSDDFLHFLRIKKKNCRIHQNYLVALKSVKGNLYNDKSEIFLQSFQFMN